MVEINYECIKDLLKYLQEYLGYDPETHARIRIDWKTIIKNEELLEIYDNTDIIRYNLEMMYELGYIKLSKYHKLPSGRVDIFIIEDITPNGYQFLDFTQNNTVWNKIKTTLKVYGGEGYKFLSSVGIQVVSAVIKQQMGL